MDKYETGVSAEGHGRVEGAASEGRQGFADQAHVSSIDEALETSVLAPDADGLLAPVPHRPARL
jgi:hypothetical protein